MTTSNNETKRRIFRQELFTLKEKGYLNAAVVEVVSKAHHQYHLDLLADEQEIKEHETNEKENILERTNVQVPPKVKKVRSPEEMRERNITWLLNLGVIMLLIGGLFVATSNWESMSAIMKSGSIVAVSLLFYGFAYLSKRVLNIEKTAFAFTVLGSLFLPIFILSLGWFGLLGSYLSISGEGSYYLGVLGSILPLLAYLYFAKLLNSRLFVWFTYISLTVGTAFLLAALHLPIDYFYLGMVVYNALLVYGFYSLRKQERLSLFTKELVVFVQINLVLSSLTMLFLYDQHVTNGFNILLTAIIYLSMIFVTGKKEYHFIFTTMLVYGAYQLIEHSFLETIGPILFALLGVGFLFLPRLVGLTDSLEKIFRITSAVISILAFLYVSLEGLMLRIGEPSFILLLAYLILGSHFVYMCYLVKSPLFSYLSPVFYGAALFEMLSLIEIKFLFSFHFSIEIFTVGFLLFIFLGSANLYSKLGVIRKSSRDIGLLFMIFSMILALDFSDRGELGVMLLLFSLICYLMYKLEDRLSYQEISLWILPISIGLAFVAFGEEMRFQSRYFDENYGWVAGFIVGALVLLFTSLGWGKVSEKQLDRNSFYLANIWYTFGMMFSLIGQVDPFWVRPIVFMGGVFIYLLLYRRSNYRGIPYLIATTTLVLYFTVMYSIELQQGIPVELEPIVFTGAGVILLFVSNVLLKNFPPLSLGFAWIGHLYFPLSLLLTYFVYYENSVWSFIVAIFIYVWCLRLTKKKWLKFVFLYATLTSLAGFVSVVLNQNYYLYQDHLAFIVTSGIIMLIWFTLNEFYKKATMYYWVPFSIIGVVSCLSSGPLTIMQYLITLAYILIVLIFIHIMRWVIVPVIPLILSFLATVEFVNQSSWDVAYDLLLMAGMGIVLIVLGKLLYKQLVIQHDIKRLEVDVYSPTALLFFVYLYTFNVEMIWFHAVPGVLIALALFLQHNRLLKKWSQMTSTIAVILLLEPYYSVFLRLDLPVLWEREILLLPCILLVIFIRVFWKGRFEHLTSSIQWTVLIIVALLLIQDGLSSSTIYDAIILGTLSLISLFAGMYLRIKSYFLVGTGVLLLNLFLQTRPFWGNMPWWAYLLIAGSILIFVASYNEWHKQKIGKGEETFYSRLKVKIIKKWKEWN